MLYYVAHPTSQRSIQACKDHGFGVLLTPLRADRGRIVDQSERVHPIPGLRYAIDNGAWPCRDVPGAWRPEPLLRLLERVGLDEHGHWREGLGRGFVVLPDVVGGGEHSLDLSIRFWLEHRSWLSEVAAVWLLAVQDGMTVERVRPLLERHHLGIFIGGSSGPNTPEWKWRTAHEWAQLALDLRLPLHIGRVNSLRRMALAAELGAGSCDGSNLTVYSDNAPRLARGHDGDDVMLPRDCPSLPGQRRDAVARRRESIELAIARRRFYLDLGGDP